MQFHYVNEFNKIYLKNKNECMGGVTTFMEMAYILVFELIKSPLTSRPEKADLESLYIRTCIEFQ